MTTLHKSNIADNIQTTQLLDYEACGSIRTYAHIGWACLDHNEDGVQVVLKPHAQVRNALWATGRYEWVRQLAVDEKGNFWVVC